VRTSCGIIFAVLVVGCSTEEDLYDPYPVPVDLTTGPVLVRASSGRNGTPYVAVVDTLSPMTVVDDFEPGTPSDSTRRQVDLVIRDQSQPPISRWLFPQVSTIDTHPCEDTESLCQVGLGSATSRIRSIIGADLLGRGAVSFDMPESQMRFFPDVAGENGDRGRACQAVFVSPFAGGGTLIVGGADVTYPARRIALGVCIHYDAEEADPLRRGAPGLLVVSTGLGTTLLSQSAYDRYAALVDDPAIAPPRSSLPITDLYLPQGRVEVRLGNITRIALVGEGSDQRGPCRELYANHIMSASTDGCKARGLEDDACPCTDSRNFCSTAAAVEIDRDIPVAIVSDLEPFLQALRDELRPKLPELDGILGTNALAPLRFDVDYKNERAIATCQDPDSCTVRPAVRNKNAVEEIAHCLPGG